MKLQLDVRDTVTYPLADIKVSTGSKEFLVRAGISKTLPVPVILGRDIPGLFSLINGTTDPNTEDDFLVTTRAQKKQQQEAEQEESGAMPKSLDDQLAQSMQTEPLRKTFANLYESLFMPGKTKEKKPEVKSDRRDWNTLVKQTLILSKLLQLIYRSYRVPTPPLRLLER